MVTSKMFSNQYYSNLGNIFVPHKCKLLIISIGYIWRGDARNKHNASIAHKSYWGVTCLPVFTRLTYYWKASLSPPKTTLHNQKHKHSAIATAPTFLPSRSKNIPSMHHTSTNFPIFAYRYARASYTNEWWTGATQPPNNQTMATAIILSQLVSGFTFVRVGARMKA